MDNIINFVSENIVAIILAILSFITTFYRTRQGVIDKKVTFSLSFLHDYYFKIDGVEYSLADIVIYKKTGIKKD